MRRRVHSPRCAAVTSLCGGAQRLDLGFNHLTDAGLTMLADALCRKLVDVDFIWCAFELTHLYLGGNSALTDGGIEQLRRRLHEAGREVEVDAAPMLALTLTPNPNPAPC